MDLIAIFDNSQKFLEEDMIDFILEKFPWLFNSDLTPPILLSAMFPKYKKNQLNEFFGTVCICFWSFFVREPD